MGWRSGRLWRSGAGALCLLALGAAPARTQTAQPEYAVKAAFLYKLAAFVEWPPAAVEAAEQSLKLCVLGTNPFGALLEQVTAGQRIGGLPISVRLIDTADRIAGCQVVYIASANAPSVLRTLQAVRGKPVLTVTDASLEDSARGIVHFVLKDSRVRFEVDPEAAARNGVVLSSKLISLAVPSRPRTFER